MRPWALALGLLACSSPVEDRACFDDAECGDGSRCDPAGECQPLRACFPGPTSQPGAQQATQASANLLMALPDGRVLRGWSAGGEAFVSCRSADLLDDPGATVAAVGDAPVDVDYPIHRAQLRPGRPELVDLVVLSDTQVQLFELYLGGGRCAATLQRRWDRGSDHFADVVYDAAGAPRVVFSTAGQLTVAPVQGEPAVMTGRFTKEAHRVPCPEQGCVARLLITDSGGATATVRALSFAQGQAGDLIVQRTDDLTEAEILAVAADGRGAWAVLSPEGAPGRFELWSLLPTGPWGRVASHTGPAPAQPRAAVARAAQAEAEVQGRVAWAVRDGAGLHLLSQDGAVTLDPATLGEGDDHDFPQLISVEGGMLVAWIERATEQRWARYACR